MNLSNSNIDDSAIAALSSLKGLRCLTVWSYGITAEGAARLQQALPNCVVLHESLEPSAAERRAAKWILKNKGYVAGGKGYYFGQIKQVDELTNGILTADFFDKIPSDDAENLAGLQSIENLLWGGMSQANIDKANLRELVSLRFLNLSGSDLNERSMQSIGRLKQRGVSRVVEESAVGSGKSRARHCPGRCQISRDPPTNPPFRKSHNFTD